MVFENIDKVQVQEPISSIIQDSSDLIWIATFGSGIYSFDGINVKSYTHNVSGASHIGSNVIHFVHLDQNERLWAGTDAGLFIYDRDKDFFEKVVFESDIPVSEHINFVSVEQIDSNGFLFSTYEYGLLRYDVISNRMTKLPFKKQYDKEPTITCFSKEENNRVWVGTSDGLFFLENNGDYLQSASELDQNFKSIDYLKIESLWRGKANDVWIGSSDQGVFKCSYSNKNYTVEPKGITNKKVFSILEMRDLVLVATENDGLALLDHEGKLLKKYKHNPLDVKGINSNSIWSIHVDRNERIWLGHHDSGIEVYDRNFSKFESLEQVTEKDNALASNLVRGIEKDKSGNLWIGMYGGVDVYVPQHDSIIHVNETKNRRYGVLDQDFAAESLFIDSNENVWIATWEKGIYVLRENKLDNYNIENTDGVLKTNSIKCFAEDANGRIWIASFFNGIYFIDPDASKIQALDNLNLKGSDIFNHEIFVLLSDKSNCLWVGTSGGLYTIKDNQVAKVAIKNISNGAIKISSDHPSLKRISALYENRDGNIVIGTEGAGLYEYDMRTKSMVSLNNAYNLSENSIRAIKQYDDQTLWVTGKSGVYEINLNSKTTTHYTTEDGLLSNTFNATAIEIDDNGLVYFGSNSGINYVDPKKVTNTANVPRLTFTDFKLFNKSITNYDQGTPLTKTISETKAVELTHEQDVFTIEYMGVTHTRPEKNEYAYLLEGFEDKWNYVGNKRNVTYTNLEPGFYTFKVKVGNYEGVWNEKPLELKLTIHPPWWKTRIAYSFYVLTILAALGLFIFFFRKNLKQKQQNLLKKQKREQEKSLHEAKIQFFTNISHEFRTPLTLITNPVNDLIDSSDLATSPKNKNKLLTIKRNSDRLSRLINELMDFRKLQSNKIVLEVKKVEVVEKINELMLYFKEEASYRDITLTFATNISALEASVDPNMFEKIFFNILSNAFKVTPEKGSIEVELTYPNPEANLASNKSFLLSVKDTGPGIDQKEYKAIFKRFYQVSQLNKNYYGSSGVGLEMVKSFVELHKGSIQVESELNQGSKFMISLPIGDGSCIDGNTKVSKTFEINKNNTISGLDKKSNVPNVEVESKNNGTQILIVEDNLELQHYLKEELEKSYQVHTAFNGRKGLELAIEHQPDLIITDVMMPQMNGLELCTAIKTKVETSHIPLLMLSAKSMVEDKIKGFDSGADGYISKPFNIKQLKAQIAQLLKSRKILFDRYHDNQTMQKPKATTVMDNQFISKVLHFIHHDIENPDLNVDELAGKLYLSRSQFYRKIKGLTGMTASEFLRKIRLQEAKKILNSEQNYNVSEVAFKVGFSSPSYFTKCFKSEFGHLPKHN